MNNPNWIAGDRFKLGGPDSSVEGVVKNRTSVGDVGVSFDHHDAVNLFNGVWFDEHATKLPKPLKRGDRVRVIHGYKKRQSGIVLCEWDDKEKCVSLDDSAHRVTVIETNLLTLEDSDGAH